MSNHESIARDAGALDGFVCCMVGDQQYAVRGCDARNVVRAEQMRGAAGRHPLAGAISRGGRDVPVYSLAAIVGAPDERRAAEQHILVTRGGHHDIGFLVDRVVRTPIGAEARVLPLPAVVGDRALRRFQGLLHHKDWSCLVLSPATIDPEDAATDRAVRVPPASPPRMAAGGADLVAVFDSPSLPHCPADRYAIQAGHVEALVQSLPNLPIPGAPPHVAALGWWGNHAVPLLSFNGSADDDATRRRVVVLRCPIGGRDTHVALAVIGDIALHRATPNDVPVACGALPAFVRGVFAIGETSVALLDLDALLTPNNTDKRESAVPDAVPTLV